MSLRPVCRAPQRCLAVLLFLVAWPSCGQDWPQFDLLNRRLIVSMPAGSRDEARGYDIMAAPEANEEETRMVYDEGDKRLVVMATERFQRAGKDYEPVATKKLKSRISGLGSRAKISKVGDQLIVGRPDSPKGNGAILYADAFVRHADGFVLQVSIYFNPQFHEASERCVEITNKIIASLASGKRLLGVSGGKCRLTTVNKEFTMDLELPPEWITYPQAGPDFVVHHLREITDLDTDGTNVGIYLGWFPGRPFHEREEKRIAKSATRKASLFGSDADWAVYSYKEGVLREGVEIIADVPGADMKAHIFAGAKSPAGIASVLQIMATAKAVKNPQPTACCLKSFDTREE